MKTEKRFRLRYAVLVYGLLLLLSHGKRRLWPPERPWWPDQKSISLHRLGDGSEKSPPVMMAYRDLQPPEAPAGYPILLLHGTPMAGPTFNRLAPELAKSHRILVPDLPGFGRSTWDIPDYSIRAHADYLREFLEQLGIEKVHVLGYSQGGGVALHLAEDAPEKIASVTMLSSIGVQELELLGDYALNHALYSIQLAGLWFFYEAFPHFGLLDGFLLNVPYARNFMDSDQRPLRGILERYIGPMLIIQGAEDVLVPPAAAREHARLVPQSEFTVLEGGHLMVEYQPAELAGLVLDFTKRVERGEALTRDRAPADRIQAAALPFDRRQIPRASGLTLFILMLLLALATLGSEDLACIGAGIMVANGTLYYLPATVACILGIFGGDLLLYISGRWIGQPLLRRVPFKWFLKEADVLQSEDWFASKGPGAIVMSRFMPGLRLPTYVAAGILRMPFWKFTGYFVVAACLWTPLLVWLAYLLGSRVMQYLELYKHYSLWILGGTVFLLWLILKVLVPSMSYRGRRLLLSSWRRKTRWEFWPRWQFYPPLFLYVLYLGIKHRGPTVFTAANPAMPAGGFIGESKFQILRGLAAAGELVAQSALLPAALSAAERQEKIRAFMLHHRINFPIVLKPDAGQRGEGVAIIRTDAQLEEYLRKFTVDLVVQEFAPGEEYGLFYYRFPDQERGRIFAVTDKRFLSVTGDGKNTLEHLILQDDRAVCMAKYFLRQHADHIFHVPAAGQQIPLVEVGTHCRGSVFYDGRRVLTPPIEEVMDRVSKSYSGFFFGRYDVRTPSRADFQQGRNFKIVELNGVTSEATSIYDPGHRLVDAYRILMEQWRLAFEIGAANRARGIPATSALELLRLLRRYRSAEA